jgi:cation transport regulator
MPGKRVPANLKEKLPKHAQEIYKEAYDSAYEQYKDPKKRRGSASHEATANRVAWSAVKKAYAKGDDGKWHRK